MSLSPILSIPLLSESQSGKVVGINTAIAALESAASGFVEVDVSAGGTVTLSTSQSRPQVLILEGTLAGDAVVQFPDAWAGVTMVVNKAEIGAYSLAVRYGAAGGEAVLGPGRAILLKQDSGGDAEVVFEYHSGMLSNFGTMTVDSFADTDNPYEYVMLAAVGNVSFKKMDGTFVTMEGLAPGVWHQMLNLGFQSTGTTNTGTIFWGRGA